MALQQSLDRLSTTATARTTSTRLLGTSTCLSACSITTPLVTAASLVPRLTPSFRSSLATLTLSLRQTALAISRQAHSRAGATATSCIRALNTLLGTFLPPLTTACATPQPADAASLPLISSNSLRDNALQGSSDRLAILVLASTAM